MKAYNLHSVGDLRFEDHDMPSIGPDDTLVKVMACGVCSSDIPRIFEKGTYHFPTIPGHEFSGIVEDAGENAKQWVGKRVAAFPLIPCMKCPQCEKGAYEMCESYDYRGSRSNGAFAEYVSVPAWNLLEIPDDMPFSTAALMEPAAVAYHALMQAGIKQGSKVAVVGSGAIGFLLAKWAKELFAADVVIVGTSDSKEPLAKELGLDLVSEDNSQPLTQSFDVVFECVGSSESICRAIEFASPSATVVLMGNPKGNIDLPQGVYWKILRSQLTLKGTWNSSYESGKQSDWTRALCLLHEHPEASSIISHKLSFHDLPKGLEIMRDKTEPYVKVMIIAE